MEALKKEQLIFQSPTAGTLNWAEVISRIVDFISEDKEKSYRIIVGSDSPPSSNGRTKIVTAIVVHRIGHGGIYFWCRLIINNHCSNEPADRRFRIHQETWHSLEVATFLKEDREILELAKENIEIHIDIGEKGPTREMIKEIVGMVKGMGFEVEIKPEAYVATKVADRHTANLD